MASSDLYVAERQISPLACTLWVTKADLLKMMIMMMIIIWNEQMVSSLREPDARKCLWNFILSNSGVNEKSVRHPEKGGGGRQTHLQFIKAEILLKKCK